MRETGEALLAAIADEPGDDMHWLVLSDWLEDRGDDRAAALVRLQVVLRRQLDAEDRWPCEQRLRELLTQGVAPWVPRRRILLDADVELELVLVPPGHFRMGSPGHEKGRDRSEGPCHRVKLTRGFWMGVYPVTQAQWQAVLGRNRSRFRGDERPVDNVSWLDALEFCRRLGERTGLDFRLPTEAEWEYACRAGTSTPYHSGEDLLALKQVGWCNFAEQCRTATETKPVGRYRPNAFGLKDMHGNVWEWCSDWFGPYSAEDAVDPTGPATGSGRVVRGGSWYFAPRICRSAYRFHYPTDLHTDSLGCRVVLDAGG
jgi:uncharacterized protein (TIGR02996 family)